MKLITHFELATRSTNELRVLYRNIFTALVESAPGTNDCRVCLASLENSVRCSAESLVALCPRVHRVFVGR